MTTRTRKSPQTWHPQLIKAAIHMRGMTLSKLALDSDLEESACRQALIRTGSPSGEMAISAFLNVSLHDLWPDRYDAEGRRYATRHVRVENKHDHDGAHRQIGGAR